MIWNTATAAIVGSLLSRTVVQARADTTPLSLCSPRQSDGTAVIDSFGMKYDLSPLKKEGADPPWEARDQREDNKSKYLVNVCEFIETISSARVRNAAVWQTGADGSGEVSCGTASSDIQFVEDGILTVTYEDGDICPSGNATRSSTFTFYCDPIGKADKPPTLVKNEHDCEYVFAWETPHACGIGGDRQPPSNEAPKPAATPKHRSHFGRTIGLTLLLLIVCYVVGGSCYNFFVKKESGVYIFPHWIIWSGLCGGLYAVVAAGLQRAGAGRGRANANDRVYASIPQTDEPLLNSGSDESDSDDDQMLHV